MKYELALVACLSVAGCDRGMSYKEQIEAIKECQAVGGLPTISSNIVFVTLVTCYPPPPKKS